MGRPILWNKNLWNLCVSAGWIYKLSVVYIFFEWTIDIHVILYFVCKIIRLVFFSFVVPFLCVIHRSHAIYTAVSGTFRYSSNFLPFLLFIKFSRGFKQRISSELDGYFRNSALFMETMVLSWKFLRPIT